jgi:hypothetical protein
MFTKHRYVINIYVIVVYVINVVVVVVNVVVVVVVAMWEIPGFDCCCLGILSNIPMCPYIWL